MAQLTPSRIRLAEDRKTLDITWSDGKTCHFPLVFLRKRCPCATCQADQKEKGAFYIPLFTADALTLTDVKQQGHYAIQLTWADGHHTGIYDYTYLQDLCAELASQAKDGDSA
ncbi:DUF971 domain-containing protein [bacterium]|nr:DUF971 domain-containing protein [bacterium]